ncbi:MAG: HIT domain-containing protein [Dehalococcoidia bacterium]|nr:HIT domain-containing protein [Dehalococcoidia bacterium]
MEESIPADTTGRLWAPWRIEYIRQPHSDECILCSAPARGDDEASLILHRGQWNFIMMNAYPYSPGHLMIAPLRHTADITGLTQEESAEHFELLKLGVSLLKDVANPHAFNVGLNLGRVAGAGVDQHLHTHIVPRWTGDTNFMPVIADTRVMSESLPSMYAKLKKALSKRLHTEDPRVDD